MIYQNPFLASLQRSNSGQQGEGDVSLEVPPTVSLVADIARPLTPINVSGLNTESFSLEIPLSNLTGITSRVQGGVWDLNYHYAMFNVSPSILGSGFSILSNSGSVLMNFLVSIPGNGSTNLSGCIPGLFLQDTFIVSTVTTSTLVSGNFILVFIRRV